MSNYHALQSEPGEQGWTRVAFHIPIPDEANFAGVNLKQAVKERQAIDAKKIMRFQYSQVPWLGEKFSQELEDIQNGLIVERVEKVAIDPKLPSNKKQAAIDARYNQLKGMIIAQMRDRFEFWGFDRDTGT